MENNIANKEQNPNVPTRGKNIPNLRFPEFEGVWVEKKLGEIAKIERGKFTPRPRNNPIYYGGNIPFVQTSDVVHSKGSIDSHSQTLNNKGLKVSKLFKKGDLLITIAANIGYAGVLQYDMACPDSLIGLKCKSYLYNIFLNYLLEIEQPKMDYLAVAAAQKNINIDFLKPYKFILPSLAEQTKVANFLTKIDSRISTQNKIIEDYKLLKKGLMQKIFKQELRFKDELGNMYPEWEEKKLGDLFEFSRGLGLSKNDITENGNFKCIHYGELFTTYSEEAINVKSKTNVDGKKSKIGDILMPSSDVTPKGLATATAIYEDNIVLGGDINILRPKKAIDSSYFSYLLNFSKNEIIKLVTGTTVKHIYSKDIKLLKFNIPSLSEQQRIASTLSVIDKKIEFETELLDKYKSKKQYLLQNLFI